MKPDDFLRAIRESPEDDAPRLVFADYLEEQGEPDRAEFIRVQCELARLPGSTQRAAELRRRSVQMQAEWERAWLGEWADDLVRWQFRRGFLDEITIQPEAFLDRAGTLFAQHPNCGVSFVTEEGEPAPDEAAAELTASPHFAHVRSLQVGFAWCGPLARATHVRHLTELAIRGVYRESEEHHLGALRELAGAPHLRSLRHLEVSPRTFTALGDAVLDVLAGALFAPELTSLDVGGLNVTDAGARRLAQSAAFSRLRHLDVSCCGEISRAGIETLLTSPRLTHLTDLGVTGRVDLARLAASPHLPRLRSLRIVTAWDPGDGGGTPRDPEGWQALAAAPELRLERLTLGLFSHDVEGLANLINAPGLAGLKALDLYGSSYGPSLGESVLTHSAIGAELETLGWGETVGEPQGFPIASWPGLSRLADLTLMYDISHPGRLESIVSSLMFPPALSSLALGFYVGEADLLALARCARLDCLTTLSLTLDESAVSGRVMESLVHSPHLRNLDRLHLRCYGDERRADLRPLGRPGTFPRLRDLDISPLGGLRAPTRRLLRRRFGPRLRDSEGT